MQRLGKNQGGYFGEQINVHNVMRDIESLAQQSNWATETFHAAGEFKWLALKRSTRGTPASAFISAPASTAMNPPDRWRPCNYYATTNGRSTPKSFSCRA
jgi:hypothetical protein